MKGVIETIPSFIYIIVAVAVGIFLFSLLYNYSDLFVQKQVVLEGDKNYIAKKIANEIENCWKQHRNGLDSVSGICKKLTIKSTDYFTEKDVTGFLDCQSIPNINCTPENCSFCISDYFDDQDKIKWFVENKKATIEISYLGFERVIKVSEILVEEVCEPYDRICDAACSYVSGICDKYCYRNNLEEGVPCDFDCVDYNKDGKIDLNDLDEICDLDCYNNKTDIQSAYDIDCIFRNREINDEICDPDTNGRLDGVCDPDCAKPNYICDFDCDGTVYDLAGKPLNDTDCYVCDKICNGFCSFACKPWEDPDCIEGFKGFFNLTECCNNTKCGLGENCENCLEDCPAGATCEDLNNICCPDSFDSDEFGCSGTKNLEKGESCSCDNQCNSSLECTETADTFMAYEKACCEPEKQWNGTNCTEGICPETISSCFNHWHWDHYGAKQIININIYACDYFEVCHDPVVQPIAKEIISCCNNKCEGNCHTLCSRALEDSGLAASDTETTRKKCYGLYAILGMGPAAKWTRGYQLHLEEPASIMFSSGTWMCTGYAIMLTTLLRSVGYEKNEAYGACSYNHMFNIVKFPGDTKHRIVDTVGNILCVKGMYTGGNYPYCGNFGSECGGCINDEGTFSCPSGVVC